VHGFPTSSIDYFPLARELKDGFEIFALDFPGYGVSDKPPEPYVYSLYDDARLLVHAITEVWKLTDYQMITHDRGCSVGMIAVGLLAEKSALPSDLILTNGNIYLPLSNLTAFQTALLNDKTARATAAETTPELLAAGLGFTTFMPRRTPDNPEIAALAKCFAYNDGMRVLPDTIQYLHERAADEKSWLERLSKLPVNVTLVWGLHDTVAPLRVANHVWQTYLRGMPSRSRYWVVPGADHYMQCDAPAELAQILRLTAQGESLALQLQTLGDRPDGAVLVDQA
jgi:pimeloyl-ACP methyl ester carboxylesterase